MALLQRFDLHEPPPRQTDLYCDAGFDYGDGLCHDAQSNAESPLDPVLFSDRIFGKVEGLLLKSLIAKPSKL